MNINFELYRIFYTVCNTLNITKAAEQLMISQPAISKSIKNLEDQLGGKVFVRTKRGVRLTAEGEEFYNYIKQAIEFINNAEHKFTQLINLEIGTIKIGVSTTLTKEFLIKYLEQFHKLYPKIDIQISTNVSEELLVKLRNGLLDLVILNLPYNCSDDFEVIKVKEIHDCFIVNKDYLSLTKKTISLNDLNNYPLILQSKKSSTRTFIDDFCHSHNVTLKTNTELSSYSLVVEFTKAGFGIGFATKEYIKNELNNKELFELKIEPKLPPRYIGIVSSKKNVPNFSTKKLIEIILKGNVK